MTRPGIQDRRLSGTSSAKNVRRCDAPFFCLDRPPLDRPYFPASILLHSLSFFTSLVWSLLPATHCFPSKTQTFSWFKRHTAANGRQTPYPPWRGRISQWLRVPETQSSAFPFYGLSCWPSFPYDFSVGYGVQELGPMTFSP